MFVLLYFLLNSQYWPTLSQSPNYPQVKLGTDHSIEKLRVMKPDTSY